MCVITYVRVLHKYQRKTAIKNIYRKALYKLAEAGLKVNTDKSLFGQTETDYLGFWVISQGMRSLSSKVDNIKKINAPSKVHDARRFVGLLNYYRDMWHKRACTLAPLNK